jgi:hypothetical protein
MTETAPDRKAEAAALRAYAKQQGQLARDLKAGVSEPVWYRVEETRGDRTVKIQCPRGALTAKEAKRQVNEAVRFAEASRAEANRKAKKLEDG